MKLIFYEILQHFFVGTLNLFSVECALRDLSGIYCFTFSLFCGELQSRDRRWRLALVSDNLSFTDALLIVAFCVDGYDGEYADFSLSLFKDPFLGISIENNESYRHIEQIQSRKKTTAP